MTGLFDRQRLGRFAQWFAVAVAVALPWSTTLTGIFLALWFVTLVSSFEIPAIFHKP